MQPFFLLGRLADADFLQEKLRLEAKPEFGKASITGYRKLEVAKNFFVLVAAPQARPYFSSTLIEGKAFYPGEHDAAVLASFATEIDNIVCQEVTITISKGWFKTETVKGKAFIYAGTEKSFKRRKLEEEAEMRGELLRREQEEIQVFLDSRSSVVESWLGQLKNEDVEQGGWKGL
ncbi:hypothetical protein EJ04DRAFT_579156 [Polyplosphaeria fusca]|uniref:Uncharacterized protein n=1 Tax=Polyplosphaeria fusca TaxID=682080 RepID=A0A9P4QUU9_9PLEO|nr:hypothetical protein EJ04DRAFT_579156 [Polyplosphaeria fusca]